MTSRRGNGRTAVASRCGQEGGELRQWQSRLRQVTPEGIPHVRNVRARFASLWVSQVARVLADWALRMAAVAEWARLRPASPSAAWYLATVVFVAPWVVLAPLNGCLCNGLPRRGVLVGASAYT